MTRIETARVREVLGMNITGVKEAAERLDPESDLQELDDALNALERAVAELRSSIGGLPFKHSE
ncbi:MAG TPA: hypothetical protein VJ550_07175 [Geomonas sp.]|nr:hypothetical protein [Geomonas sp.]